MLVGSVARYPHLNTGLGASLAFVGAWPWAAYVFMPVIAETLAWETATTVIGGCYLVSLGAVGIAVSGYGLFDTEPAAGNVGAATVLEELADPVFVLDRTGTVLRVNAAAEATFGIEERAAVGQPLDATLGVDADTLAAADTTDLDTTAGRRQFETTRSGIAGHGDRPRGEAIVLRDVTRRETRQQRLQVLSRVLRHNLRNDINVIRGRAELISDGGVADPERSADTIRELSDQLISLSERAREAQQVVSREPDGNETTAVAPVVTAVHDELGERYPEVALSAAVPDDITVDSDGETLEIVLRNLVENACEHNDAESPIVTTAVDRTQEAMVRIIVRDNGPGIPQMERAVVEAGSEDPLEHGSGMGLWTVRWGVTRMGGQLSFAENTPTGTIVQLVVPDGDQ